VKKWSNKRSPARSLRGMKKGLLHGTDLSGGKAYMRMEVGPLQGVGERVRCPVS